MGATVRQLEQLPDYIKRVLIIDDDQALRTAMSANLKGMSIRFIKEAENGREALAFLKDHYFDLIILDWKMPEMSGPVFLDKLRLNVDHAKIPVLIFSGYLHSQDFQFLEEHQFTRMQEKPGTPFVLKSNLQKLLEERLWFEKEEKKLKARMRRLFQNGDLSGIRELIENSPKPVPMGVFLARQLVNTGRLEHAKEILELVAKSVSGSISVQTELGKVYLALGDLPSAKKALSGVSKNAPDSVDRLCVLGDLCLQDLDIDEAKKAFESALQLDRLDPQAQSGLEIVQEIESYLTQSKSGVFPRNLASMLNAVGITKVRGGEHTEGIEHYFRAIEHVYDGDTRGRLALNIALGYLRQRQEKQAFLWFSVAHMFCQDDAAKIKARSHIEKLLKKMNNEWDFEEINKEVQNLVRKLGKVKIDLEGNDDSNTSPYRSSTEEEERALEDELFSDSLNGQIGKSEMQKLMEMEDGTGEDPGEFGVESADQIHDVEQLLEAVPEAKQLKALLAKEGLRIPDHLDKYLSICEKHGIVRFREACQMALEKKTPGFEHINFLIQKTSVI